MDGMYFPERIRNTASGEEAAVIDVLEDGVTMVIRYEDGSTDFVSAMGLMI